MSYYEHVLRESFDFIVFALNSPESRTIVRTSLISFFQPEYVKGALDNDLPFEESASIKVALDEHGIGMALFAAPTTDERRLREIATAQPSFIYAVADMGVTGRRDEVSDHLEGLVRRIRAVTSVPVVLGVGISTPEQAGIAAGLADGVIVGSALVAEVLDEGAPISGAAFADAVHGAHR